MKDLTSLFLSQSYKDTWDDYTRALKNENFTVWDYIILTASDEQQAESFRYSINIRIKNGLLPSRTKFAVIPDPEGKRVGSGGATLGVIKYLCEDLGHNDFSGLKILVIHSGGDSKRVPQYSALGKLFSPVPHTLPDGRPSTLFDEFMITMSSVPPRIHEGMLLLSGDVLLLFNPLQIDFSGTSAAISFKENVETGKNHGVFLRDENGFVKKFLHKQSVEELKRQGAVNERGCVDIDTGAILFSTEVVTKLSSLITENGKVNDQKFDRYVNDKVRLSLYGDFLYPLAKDSTEESFQKEQPEGEFSKELEVVRKEVFSLLSPCSLKLLRLAPAKFIHLGTTREILKLLNENIDNYHDLGWSNVNFSVVPQGVSGYNGIVSPEASVKMGAYIENSFIGEDVEIGENSLISFIEIKSGKIPPNVVLHGLKLSDGKFQVRIFGTADNPKQTLEDNLTLFGKDFKEFMNRTGLKKEDIWQGADSLWEAKLYPLCSSIDEGIKYALMLYDAVMGKPLEKEYIKSDRQSLKYGFYNVDSLLTARWNERMQELVIMEKIYCGILDKIPASQFKNSISGGKLSKIQKKWLDNKLKILDTSKKMRLNYYIGTALDGKEGEKYKADFFALIKDAVNDGSGFSYMDNCKIVKQSHTVNMPLRVNFGGGWSDTPPYCNENGGTVLNAAILLNGKMPVEVKLTKLKEKMIIFESHDMGTYREFTSLEELQKTGDPYDLYALQKAGLIATGIIPEKGGNFDEILTRLGGGFKMQSEVTGVPKGSGLGTSSILAGAVAKALIEFVGIEKSSQELYDCVLKMEQIMSTGGGWQDQVGGMENGIKIISSRPGISQKLTVTQLNMDKAALDELQERYCLIYTGQRRLARNLLRDVIGNYIGNSKDSLYAHEEIQKLAVLMKFSLEKGDIDAFAELLDKHWKLSKMIDGGSTNTLIDYIFESVNDLVTAKMICGAGGGGFLQVILKKGVTKDELRLRLKDVFQDNDVDLWNTTFI